MKNLKQLCFVCLLACLAIFAGCEKEKEVVLEVVTVGCSDIGSNTATLQGSVSYNGDADITSGFYYDLNSDMSNALVSNSTSHSTGSFTAALTGLRASSTYYYQAYAIADGKVVKGEVKSFATNVEGSSTPSVPGAPKVTTCNVSEITTTSAKCGGDVTSQGDANVTNRGVCWSTSPNPTISDSRTTNGAGTGSFTSSITNLTAYTTYYVRAYATNSIETSYGEQKIFKTNGIAGGHEYVDLGLSVKWATCNVGSSTPEDYGNYYAWGETSPKTSAYTYSDNPTTLPASADAATANWGGGWRMPTKEECEELLNNCTWQWTTLNGVNGCLVTGTNGNTIFLPAAGGRSGTGTFSVGSEGQYWSGSVIDSRYAWLLYFGSDGHGMSDQGRVYGLSVRAVCQ